MGGDVVRQVAGLHRGPAREDDGALDHVLELAHVARPGVALQAGERLVREAVEVPVVLGGVHPQEVLGQHRHVFPALAQGRRGDRDDVEPVVEVLPEALLAHEHGQVLVGGGDDPHVDAEGLGPPHPLELALLEHPEDLGLRDRREVGHLVEEEGAAVGQLEAPFLPPRRPREGALLVAEELRLEQPLGQRRAVDGDERALPPR